MVTEEDYRSYPDRMASFVNIVRQAAMECVLCLVGFSGSDPNFLSWTGWVRDQLGHHSPQIFLATLTQQSSSERQVLESRGIRLIDLSRLKGLGNVAAGERHRAALDWFVRNLREGRRLTSAADWPRSKDGSTTRKDDLAPIPPGPRSGFPGFPPPPRLPMKADEGWLLETVSTWQKARRCYPGWLVAPSSTRTTLAEELLDTMRSVLGLLAGAPLAVRLVAIAEVVWQLDVCHLPPTRPLREAILAATAAARAAIDGKPHQGEAFSIRVMGILAADEAAAAKEERISARTEIGRAWIELNFALLRNAREIGDLANFEGLLGVLKEELDQASDLRSRLCYEQCLLAASRLDLKALTAAIQSWRDESLDPYYEVLRAGVLADMGDLREAEQLCAHAIKRLRSQQRPGVDDVFSTSRECWALVLYLGLNLTRSFTTRDAADRDATRIDERELRQRFQSRAAIAGDPWKELAAAFDAIERADIEWQRGRSRWAMTGGSREAMFRPALAALRLIDDVGLPAQVGSASLTRKLRMRAIQMVKPLSLSLATAALLRAGAVEDKFDEITLFERTWIARLDGAEAEALSKRLSDYLATTVGRYRADRGVNEALARHWQESAKFAAQLQGRLVTRLSVGRINEVASEAVEYFRRGEVDHVWLQDSFTYFFGEAMGALPTVALSGFVIKLLDIPYRPNDAPFAWPSALGALERFRANLRRDQVGEDIGQRIAQLLRDAADDRDEIRSEALVRLAILHASNLLQGTEVRRFSDVLWAKLDGQGFPQARYLRDDALMLLPEPHQGAADEALRRKYLWDHNPFDLPDALRDSRQFRALEGVLSSLVALVARERPAGKEFSINAIEADALTKRLVNIYNLLADGTRRDYSAFDRAGLLNLIQIALAETAIPNLNREDHAIVRLVEENLRRWRDNQDPTLEASLSATRLPLSEPWPVEAEVKRDLRSHKAELVGRSLKATERWLRHGSRWGIHMPKKEVFVTLGLLVEDGWPEILPDLLSTATALTDTQPTELETEVLLLLRQGLSHLAERTAYARIDDQGEDGIGPGQVPIVRVGCAKLALSLEKAGKGDATVAEWLEAARTDPLSEVRRAVDVV